MDTISIITVKELPKKPKRGAVYSIDERDVAYLTHNFFKYPCKFIPQIPLWAMQSQLGEIKGKKVLDPFSGSGTTTVEATLNGAHAYYSDIDPLSRLLTRVKARKYSENEVTEIRESVEVIIQALKRKTGKLTVPDLPNLEHWFREENIRTLGRLRALIDEQDDYVRDFLLVVLASIIRKSSRADEVSPKPYVSTRFSKPPVESGELFTKTARKYLERLKLYAPKSGGKLAYEGLDARKLELPSNSMDIAITSPPYINAFDYVRSLKLENYWLGYIDEENIGEIQKANIGTEYLSKEKGSEVTINSLKLKSATAEIYDKDKKRARVVNTYFEEMRKNLIEINRVLKPGAKYVMVVADSMIRNIYVPTHEILQEIALENNYTISNRFGYVIQNRYLRIPRAGQGGLMKIDWVIVMEKTA
jgi:DNA modification methylase